MFDRSRTEAFSDGVIAVAITLLALNLAVPARGDLHGRSLWSALGHHWASYLAYVVSFLTIGIIWVNHHALLATAHRIDRAVIFANIMLLMVVVVMPFSTSLIAEYLTAPGASAHTAAVVYAANNLAMALAFTALYLCIARTAPDATVMAQPRAVLRFGAGGVVYLVTVVVGFFSAPAVLAIAGATALYYCVERVAGVERPPPG